MFKFSSNSLHPKFYLPKGTILRRFFMFYVIKLEKEEKNVSKEIENNFNKVVHEQIYE